MSKDFAKPAPLSEKSFFEARAEKVTFVNPKGLEMYGRVCGYKADVGEEKSERKKRWSLNGDTLAKQGRPVK